MGTYIYMDISLHTLSLVPLDIDLPPIQIYMFGGDDSECLVPLGTDITEKNNTTSTSSPGHHNHIVNIDTLLITYSLYCPILSSLMSSNHI